MKRLNLTELHELDYKVAEITSLVQVWEDVRFFDCTDSPKRESIMLSLCGYDAVYTLPDGRKIEAKDGSVTYTATGSRYRVDFFRAAGTREAHDDSVRFKLFLGNEELVLNEDVAVFRPTATMRAAFSRLHALSRLPSSTQADYKPILYSILNEAYALRRDEDENSDFSVIRPGYDYINEHYDEDFSVSVPASLCFVSEVWFRKAFRSAIGTSPSAYKTELRLNQAAKLLACGNMSVQEIASAVGYDDVSLFIRRFRSRYGATPLSYRNSCRTHD